VRIDLPFPPANPPPVAGLLLGRRPGLFIHGAAMLDDRKRLEVIKVTLTERELHEVGRICAAQDRSPADLVHLVLRKYLFGHSVPYGELVQRTDGDSQ